MNIAPFSTIRMLNPLHNDWNYAAFMYTFHVYQDLSPQLFPYFLFYSSPCVSGSRGVKIRSFKMETVAAPVEFKCHTNMEVWKTFSLLLLLLSFQPSPLLFPSSILWIWPCWCIQCLQGLLTPGPDSGSLQGTGKMTVHLNSNGPSGSWPPSNHTHSGTLPNKKQRKALLTQPMFANKKSGQI